MNAYLFSTALGPCGIATRRSSSTSTQRDLVCALQLPEATPEQTKERLLRRIKLSDVTSSLPAAHVQQAIQNIQQYLDGNIDSRLNTIPLDEDRFNPFSRRVYRALQRVRPGAVLSYRELGQRANAGENVARAVGQAMARNPIPLVIPCHRVIDAEGRLGSYSAYGGPATKMTLLTMEGVAPHLLARGASTFLRRKDKMLGHLIKRSPPFPIPSSSSIDDPFTALCRDIVCQQLSLKAGQTIVERVLASLGDSSTKNGKTSTTLSPRAILKAKTETMRSLGLSSQKATYLKALAEHVLNGALDFSQLIHRDDESVIATLTQVKGIGRWTAEMFLIFHLHRLDVLSVGDLGIRKAMQRLYRLDELPSPETMRTIAQAWIPYRSVASWYLWRSLEAQ